MKNKKLFKHLLLLTVAFCSVFILFSQNFGEVNAAIYEYNSINADYEIKNYNVNINADKNNHVFIEEVLEVNFLKPKSSLIRDIPVNEGVLIRDIKVLDRAFSVEKNDDFFSVDLDSSNFTPSIGLKIYKLSYTLITPNKKAKDTVALNVIGQGWDAKILNATINIELPEAPIKSYYYVGKRGATGGQNRLTINGEGTKNITIKTTNVLNAYEGITAGFDMPEGTLKYSYDVSFLLIALGAVIVFAVYLINKTTKKQQIFPVINFTAPNKLDPAEIGLLIDGYASAEDLTSLIFYWASKGYIIINEEKKGHIILEKIRELPSESKTHQHIIFGGLFKKGNVVAVKSLTNSFYSTMERATSNLNVSYSGKLYDGKSIAKYVAISLLASLYAFITSIVIGYKISSVYFNPTGFFTIIPSALILVLGFFTFRYQPKMYENKGKAFLGYIAVVSVAAIVVRYLIGYLANIPKFEAWTVAAVFAFVHMLTFGLQKRKDGYNAILNEVIGFKQFLTHAEKKQLETMLEDNPQFYYEILPYANVLGVSEIWTNKFRNLTIQPPNWYRGYTMFDFLLFNAILRNTMRTISTTSISKPSSSGKGGSGFGGGFGGGFSGGGFGGGGGRAR